ncbi:DUF4190 domain-containing protein [Streptomyces sp. PT12]|uniref:DUF4190 domain-containing protein n=1 Tax=Streptomyces sp. PT12 TaxID=1510197 RepID=UPI0015EF1EB5|nr:DUF4190 domain-containing protein [Streptomyces sp. PT12]
MSTPPPPDAPPPPPAQGAAPLIPQAPAVPPRQPFGRLPVWAFITSFGVFPLGLMLGVLALARPRVTPERGRGLAVAGLVIASLQVVALAVAVPLAVMSDPRGGTGDRTGIGAAPGGAEERESAPGGDQGDGSEGTDGEDVQVNDIEAGDCFDPGTSLDAFGEGVEETFVTRRPCEGPHEAEAFGTVLVEGHDAFPGDEEILTLAEEECDRLIQGYVLDTWALPLDVSPYYYHPTRDSWQYGDREVICFLGHLDGGQLDETLRGDASGMSEDQLGYLEITTPLDLVTWSEPLPEADLADRQVWAARMAEVVEAETEALADHAWSPGVDELIGRLVRAREESLASWSGAAGAVDADAFDAYVDTGYAVMGIELEVEIRDTLGLATGA